MIDFCKTHTEINTEKIFNTDTMKIIDIEIITKKHYCTETVIERILKTDTEMIAEIFLVCFNYLLIYWHQWQTFLP